MLKVAAAPDHRSRGAEILRQRATNVGGLMGPASGGLTDVDLDCREASGAGAILPADNASDLRSRQQAPSHYLYTCHDPDPQGLA